MIFLYEGKLNDLDYKIAKQIEENPTIISGHNIFDAADILGISPSKLTKYCNKVSLNGFKEMKYKIIQELEYQENMKMAISDVNINNLFTLATSKNVRNSLDLINNSERMIIVCSSQYVDLGNYISRKLRLNLNINCFCYAMDENFQIEYLNQGVITVFLNNNIDENRKTKWYRTKQNYIHITTKAIMPFVGYIPLVSDEDRCNLSYEIRVMIFFEWVINNKQ